jgi:transcriptional regulator with XRE-family HTH domain
MSPFSLSHILDQVVRDQAGRMALEARQHGRASDIPESYYLERIADRSGVTKRQLYRWLAGEASPSTAMLLRLCEICETTLPIEWLCREVGLTYARKGGVHLELRDLVQLVSRELQDASAVAQDVL